MSSLPHQGRCLHCKSAWYIYHYTTFSILCQSSRLKMHFQIKTPPVAIGKTGGVIRLQIVSLLLTNHLGGHRRLKNRFTKHPPVRNFLGSRLFRKPLVIKIRTNHHVLSPDPRHRPLANHFTSVIKLTFNHQLVLTEPLLHTNHLAPDLALGSIVVIIVTKLLTLMLVLAPVRDVDGTMEARTMTTIVNFTPMNKKLITHLIAHSLNLVNELLFSQHSLTNDATILLHLILPFRIVVVVDYGT